MRESVNAWPKSSAAFGVHAVAMELRLWCLLAVVAAVLLAAGHLAATRGMGAIVLIGLCVRHMMAFKNLRSCTSLLQDHALTAPVSWIAVGECLGEGPPVAADVPDDVLPLAVDMIDRRLQDLRAAGSDVLEVGSRPKSGP